MSRQTSLFSLWGKKTSTPQSPPPVKKAKTDQERRDQQKVYDKEVRVRKFQPKWQTEFVWLLYDPNHEKVYCKPCRSIYGPYGDDIRRKQQEGIAIESNKYSKYALGSYVLGSNVSKCKRDNLIAHQKSQGHKDAIIKMNNKRNPGQSTAEKMIKKLNEGAIEKLNILFCNSHAIAKHIRPFSDLVWMCDLDEVKGIDIGSTYRNDKSCRIFVKSIAEVERLKLERLLMDAKYFTILSDGSSSVSVSENEIVYLRFAIGGIVYTFFVGIVEVEKADAQGVYNALMKVFQRYLPSTSLEDLLKKLIAYCCDGASVNTGQFGGVIALLRKNAWLGVLLIQCMAHRLELAYKESVKNVKIYDRVNTLLNALFSFYHTSCLQHSNLRNAFTSLGQSMIKPKRIGGTRWLSHTLEALTNMINGYEGFVLHLGQEAQEGKSKMKAKALSLHKLLTNRGVVTFSHFLLDVLNILKSLSLDLQKTDAVLYDCHRKLELTVVQLEKLKTRPGFHLRQILEKTEFHGQHLSGNLDMFNGPSQRIIDSLIDSIKACYSDMDQGILTATKIVDLKDWPSAKEDALNYGDDAIVALIDHFEVAVLVNSALLQVDKIEQEWTSLKATIYDNHTQPKATTWEEINEKYADGHRNILSVIDLVLSLPPSTAECERGFSLMKLTKTDIRNKLKTSTLSDIMTIKLHSPAISTFDPLPAIQQWNSSSSRARRPHFKSQGAVCGVSDVVHDISAMDQDSDIGAINTTSLQPSLHDADSDFEFDNSYSDLESDSDYNNDSEDDLARAIDDLD